MIHAVLFATDLSENTPAALSYAVHLASIDGAKLFLVHVLDPADANASMDSSSSDLRDLAQSAKSELTHISDSLLVAQGVQGEVLVRYGNVRDVIFQLQQEYSADLVVLGSSGRKTGRGKGLGSIAEAILRGMPCNVLTIGPKVMPPAISASAQMIVFATDFSDGSLAALPTAASLAAKFSANLLLLHICNPYEPHSYFTHELACRKKLTEIAQSVKKQKMIRIECLVREGQIGETVLSVAEEKHADFIVMGVHHGDLQDGTRLHGIVAEVVREARCPVFTIADRAKPQIQ